MIRAHLLIRGEVQGVFYRASAQEEALRLGLVGWIRNLSSGDVDAEVEGPEALVDEFIAWCRRGPPTAQVVEVEVSKKPPQGDFKTFSILRRS